MREKIFDFLKQDISLKRPRKKDLAILCRQLYALLDAGLGIVDAIKIAEGETENQYLKKGLNKLHLDVEGGDTLFHAMNKNNKLFTYLLVNMVAAGESSGNLDLILKRMAEYFEKEYKIENRVRNAMIYPIILITVSVFILLFVMVYIMPIFIDLFQGDIELLPMSTRLLLNISNGLKDNMFSFGIILILIAFIVFISGKSKKGRIFKDMLKIKTPIFNRLNKLIITSNFTRTLSILIGSGVPLLNSIDIGNRVIDNNYVFIEINKAKEDIRNGTSMYQAFNRLNLFPTMFTSMVKVGEETSSLGKILDITADYYDEEINNKMENFTTILEPLLIIIMAIIIGFIVISIAMPMFNMVNTISY